MNKPETQLLCTFFDSNESDKVLNDIIENLDLSQEKIFVIKTDDGRLFYSYNVNKKDAYKNKLRKTMMVHRKQDSNTIFSINALNELQKRINNGVSLPPQEVNWSNYKDQLLLYSNNILTINNIKLIDVVIVKYRKNNLEM